MDTVATVDTVDTGDLVTAVETVSGLLDSDYTDLKDKLEGESRHDF